MPRCSLQYSSTGHKRYSILTAVDIAGKNDGTPVCGNLLPGFASMLKKSKKLIPQILFILQLAMDRPTNSYACKAGCMRWCIFCIIYQLAEPACSQVTEKRTIGRTPAFNII